MRSQNSILAHTTLSLNALSLTANRTKSNGRQLQHHHYTIPVCEAINIRATPEPLQMTTGGSISGNNTNSAASQQKSGTSTLSSCNTIASTSSINTLSKASTISSTARHSNGNLSTHSNNNNNNSTTAVNNNNNNNKTVSTKNNNNNNNSHNNNNNNNEGNINQNPNWNKLQTLEQRKLELEKLLNEKNWLLQQIHKQEAQILNGNYVNLNLFEIGKVGANIVNPGSTTGANSTNSIHRRKGSSSLKLSKSNVHFNGKNNRLTLSKSEYDLAQENKLNHQSATQNPNVMSMKKRQGPPQKTNSFHDSTPASALSLTKSPSFEYNGGTAAQSPVGVIGGSSKHAIKYSVVRPHQGSTENLSSNIGVTQCDKYYLSPTSQMYSDGSGFIKASQNIKQCLSPSPLHKIIALNDTDGHRAKQQQSHTTNGQKLVHHNGSQPHLEQYESVDTLSLSPSTNCAFDQGQHIVNQHSNLWRTIPASDRSAWCDSTSYVELDSDGGNMYHNIKPLPKKVLPGSSMQQSPESPSLGNFYPVGGMVVGSYPNTVDKASDEISISSVNSETSKKPKNKQWMESSLDGPIIRPNVLQITTSVVDAIAVCPALSPTLSQNPQYTYYIAGRQTTSSSVSAAAAASGKLTTSPAPATGGGTLLMPVVTSRPPTRTLAHHSHPHHKQSYRERTKLSSQSMSSGSYRAPKTKLDDDTNHLSHSTSFLNVDPYNQHNFHMQPLPQQQQQQQQPYHQNHYHTEMTLPHKLLQQQHAPQIHQQKSLKPTPSSTSQQSSTLAKFSPTIQRQQCASLINGDDFVGTIRYATSVATQPSRLCNPSQAITKNTLQKAIPPNSLIINTGPQLSPQTSVTAATSPDIRIESPKNMTVVQQATFLPYKEVTKPFEMSDFYKYSTKFRQKDPNTATISKNTS